MSELLKQIKTLITPLTKHIEELETHNKALKNALSDLLEEEDVKLIPGYELLKTTYETYLNDDVSLIKAKNDPMLGYDPLHAPPNLRRKKKPLIQTSLKRPSNYSSSMPDLNECMLESTPIKSKPDKIVTEVSPRDNEGVYIVEIQGKQYYLYDNYFYDIDSLLRIGEVTDDGFTILEQTIKFTTSPVDLEMVGISDDYPSFYPDITDKNIYKIIANGKVVQSVGTIENGECMIW